jgi:hypothetical protein
MWTCGCLLVVLHAFEARAEISFVSMSRNNAYTQTADGNALASIGSFLSLALTSVGPNDYDSATVSYPGPASPTVLSPIDALAFYFQTGSYPNQAAMDADFPFGTYTFEATNGGGADAATFEYTTDAYPSTLPYLTGTNYSDLQAMSAHLPFDFEFSEFSPSPSTSLSILFFTIFDHTANAIVFDAGFLPATTTGLTLPANTLLPSRQYSYELNFSDRVRLPSPGATFDAELGFDVRTTGTFTTAVPGPSSIALTAVALMGLVALGRRNAGVSMASTLNPIADPDI